MRQRRRLVTSDSRLERDNRVRACLPNE